MLSIFGEKDGLLRITRGAEAYWHQVKNIESSQSKLFPISFVEGLSHGGFMDSTMLPSFVKSQDL